MPTGQHLFESLLRLGPALGTSDELEDLRYRWMLYKSKLKDSVHLLVGAGDAQAPGPPRGGQQPACVLSCASTSLAGVGRDT